MEEKKLMDTAISQAKQIEAMRAQIDALKSKGIIMYSSLLSKIDQCLSVTEELGNNHMFLFSFCFILLSDK